MARQAGRPDLGSRWACQTLDIYIGLIRGGPSVTASLTATDAGLKSSDIINAKRTDTSIETLY